MPQDRLRKLGQKDRYSSPWSIRNRLRQALWLVVSALLFRPTPKQLNRWRNFLLRLFGAKIHGSPFVHSSAVIYMPWHLTLFDRACVGSRVQVYNLGNIIIHERAVIAQEVYLCAGTHDLSDPQLPLLVGDIIIGAEAFIGVRALILPGVEIGAGSVVGAGAVVARDTQPWSIYAGNPAKPLKPRHMHAITPDR
jgi:putative colanic acid biosynthesis acetyltransferase WcaF